MSDKTEQNSVYEKLTPQRKLLYDMLLKHLESNSGVWEQGWIGLFV